MSNLIRNWANPIFSALDFDNFPSSVANLPAALTINGITVMPTFRYKGSDAGASTWAPWGYGGNLSVAGSGTDITINDGGPLLGSLDDSVKFNAGGYYQASNTSFANVTTEDLVTELVLQVPLTQPHLLIGKVAASPETGWYVQWAGTQFNCLIDVAANYYSSINSCTNDTVIHLISFHDRSGSVQTYANGVAGTAAASIATSCTNANYFQIGAALSAQNYSGRLFYAAMWQSASWLDTHLQATVAATRFAQLCGIYPQKALGTALPSVVTRSTAGYLDRIPVEVGETTASASLFYMGANWPRVCSRKDTNGVEQRGYLSESAATNVCLQSHTFATTWSPTRASVPTTAVVCPDGITRTTCTLHEDGTAANTHYLGQTTGAAGTCMSFFIKAVNRDWVRLSNSARVAWFNVSTGVVGTVSATGGAGIIYYGDGWFRCYMVDASDTTVAILVGSADNTAVFDGLNQDSIYIFGAQLETGNYPSSYIPTTTTAVTRTADSLRYVTAETRTNLCLQSQTFNTTWAPTNASIPATAVVCPDGIIRTTCTLHEDSTAAAFHYIQIPPTQSYIPYVFSCYVKAANRSWVGLYGNNTAVKGFFDVTNGVVGTQVNSGSGMTYYGNGWWRCWITFTGFPTTYIYIFAAEADNDITFNGLNQDSLYIFGAQFETGTTPTSYIPTTTTAVSIIEPSNVVQGQGSLECNVLLPDKDQALSPTFWMISNNTDTSLIEIVVDSGADVPKFSIINSTAQAAISGVTDLWNGASHNIRAEWSNNNAKLYIDKNSEGTPDVSVLVPSVSQLDVGAYRTSGYELNGLISKIKISK